MLTLPCWHFINGLDAQGHTWVLVLAASNTMERVKVLVWCEAIAMLLAPCIQRCVDCHFFAQVLSSLSDQPAAGGKPQRITLSMRDVDQV